MKPYSTLPEVERRAFDSSLEGKTDDLINSFIKTNLTPSQKIVYDEFLKLKAKADGDIKGSN